MSNWSLFCRVCHTMGHVTRESSKMTTMSCDERWSTVKWNHLCIKCFSTHMLKDCGYDSKCCENDCTQSHHMLLHREEGVDTPVQQSQDILQPNDDPIEESKEQLDARQKMVSVNCCQDHRFKFQVVNMTLWNGFDRELKTYAFLGGSCFARYSSRWQAYHMTIWSIILPT